jgi:hypothetical protein
MSCHVGTYRRFFFFSFVVVLCRGIWWHLHRFIQCIRHIINEFNSSTRGLFWCMLIILASILFSPFLFFFLFIYSHVHTLLGNFSILLPLPPPFPLSPPQFQAGPVLPLWLILLKKRHKHNKKDKVFASW